MLAVAGIPAVSVVLPVGHDLPPAHHPRTGRGPKRSREADARDRGRKPYGRAFRSIFRRTTMARDRRHPVVRQPLNLAPGRSASKVRLPGTVSRRLGPGSVDITGRIDVQLLPYIQPGGSRLRGVIGPPR